MCSLEKTLPWGNHVALLHDPPLDRPWANLGALLARPQSCHGNEHHGIDPIKFRPSQLFCTGCLSLRSCQTAMLPHVGTPFQLAPSTFRTKFNRANASVVLSSSFIWATGKMQYNRTRSYEGRYRFGSSLYRFTWFGVPCHDFCLLVSVFKPWSWGWLVGCFFAEKKCIFQNSLEEEFFVVVVCWCRTSWHQISNYQLYHFDSFCMPGPIWNMCHNALSANLNAGRAALIIRIKMYIYVAAVLNSVVVIRYGFHFLCQALNGCWCTRGSKTQFLGIGCWRVPRPGKFWQLDMCSPGACFHNFGRNTCLLLSHQVRVSVLGVHCIGFHEFNA